MKVNFLYMLVINSYLSISHYKFIWQNKYPNMSAPVTYNNASFLGKYNARKRNRETSVTVPSTHTSFIGGSYVVPLEKRSLFYQEYYNEFVKWLTGGPTPPVLFLIERYNNEHFRFFIDIDYKWTETPPSFHETIVCIIKGVSSMLSYMDDAFYDQAPLEVRPSDRTDHKRHLVFPQVIVDSSKALLFAQAVEKHVNVTSDLALSFDMNVYQNGSLRMLGSCKNTGLESTNENETEFFYMPVDANTGERQTTLGYDEFRRHCILLDKDISERVEKFVALEDGSVCLPADDANPDVLYVISKYIHNDVSCRGGTDRLFLSDTIICRDLSETHPIYQFIKTQYGEIYANTIPKNGVKYNEWCETLTVSFSTRSCPFVAREHTSNHPYFILNRNGASMKCYSNNDTRCNGRFHPIQFGQIDDDTKTFFWSLCMASVEKHIPESMLVNAKLACEENMAFWGCVSMDVDSENEPLELIGEKLVTRRKNCFYRCMTSDLHRDMRVETDINGTFLTCIECGSRHPDNRSQGLWKTGLSSLVRPLFTALEAFKNRGVSVFEDLANDIEVEQIGNSPMDGRTGNEMNYSSDRVRLLQLEMYEDGLSIFDDAKQNNAFILSMSGTDRDVAIFMELQLGDDFVATSAEKGDWYCFQPPRWRGGEYAQNLLFLFVDNIVNEYVNAIGWYRSNFTGTKEAMDDRIKKIEKVMHKLGDVSFIKKVMNRLAHFRLDVEFLAQLDQNRTLLCFNDGVYNLDTFLFRQGAPEDKLSMTVGYDFPHSPDPAVCREILQFFEDIQPEAENRTYLKTFLSSLIDGRTNDELFHILSGRTRNAKSVIADAIKMALGCHDIHVGTGALGQYTYAGDYEPSFLTKERKGSSDPVPDLLVNRLARALIGSEPDAGDKINAANLKKYTGGDTLSGRMLHSNDMIFFKPHFKLLLICNDIPEMNHNDDAVWRRARVIDFPVTFVDNPVGPLQRKIDRTFKDRIRNIHWARNFMALLIEWHRTLYTVFGLKAPPSVLRATRQYEEESNIYLQWWDENTEPSASHISSKDLMTNFCLYANKHNVSIKEFNKGLRQIHVNVKKAVRTTDGVFAGVEKRQLKKSVVSMPADI